MAVTTHEQAAVSAALERIRYNFIDGLDMRILNFENALAEGRRNDDNRAALLAIRAEAHKIAGIAASIGYSETGGAARAIEERIDHGLAACTPDTVMHEVEPRLEEFLDGLEELLDAAGTADA